MAAEGHQAQLLLQAAQEAVGDFQAGRIAPASVDDILHLEKIWVKLPGAGTGKVALDDARDVLHKQVLAGEPLEYVVQEVLAAQGQPDAPPVLTKRQFLALAHVAEVVQSKAFDLVTAEDAAVPRAEPASAGQKKRPPPIRDAHIDTWRIAAAVPASVAAYGGEEEGEEADSGGELHEAAARGLSRAISLVPGGAAGPLDACTSALWQHDSAAEELGDSAAEAALHQQQQHRGASFDEVETYGVEAEAGEDHEAALPLDAEVEKFTTQLNGLMERVSSDVARHTLAEGQAPEGMDGQSAVVPGEGNTRGSWESFNSGGSGRSASATVHQQQASVLTPASQQQAPQQQLSEAVISAAVAAGISFMQHLQAGGHGADSNPLQHAAAVAAAAVAASPSLATSHATGASSPDVWPLGAAHANAAAAGPQQMIAEMMAHLNLDSATPEELQAAAAGLQQQALARQQQQQRPATSHAGSAGSAASADHSAAQASRSGDSVRRSWRAFDDENQSSLQQQQHYQHPRRDLSASPQKPSRLGPGAAAAARDAIDMPPPAPRLRPPAIEGLCGGWTAMSVDDQRRCQAIFKKKGYNEVGGMERHYAMEYFAKLHMEGGIFHTAWAAADQGGDGRLDCREFCLFVQLLRGAQQGRPLPARLTPEEAAALLGEAPMPPEAAAPQQQQTLHIDTAHMRVVLGGGGHSRQGSMVEHAESVIQGFDPEDDDGASSVDSGLAESVISTSSRRGAYPPAAAHHSYALGARPAPAPARSRLGSVLGGGGGGAGAYHPAYARPERPAVGAAAAAAAGAELAVGQVAHSLLEVAVRSAEIRYRKPLSTPIFTLSVRDSLGRLVELPVDTHPGHYRRETNMIHSSAIVRLTTQLRSIPPGSILFLEIKHWKADKRRFSTLAWAYAPLEKLVDFGPMAARVRGGPVDLPLFKKPVDLTLRRTRRLTSRAFDLHLTMRGIEE